MTKLLSISLFISYVFGLYAQTGPMRYLLHFTDKDTIIYRINKPEDYLSARAIQRRINQHIAIGYDDLPVNPFYIDSLRKMGLKVYNPSKWFNSVTIESTDTMLLDTITALSFIKTKTKNIHTLHTTHADITEHLLSSPFSYGNAYRQIEIHHGDSLHAKGYTGHNMIIAVIDGSFGGADSMPAFDSLRTSGRILGVRDFVEFDDDVYIGTDHGMKVLSVMAANIPGQLIGSAPHASYWLLRSENEINYEYITEEDNWIRAAEFADSAGVDIINSSLGYNIYQDDNTSYQYSDLDGNTARISIAANIAASKGMLVITSAGNEGNKDWRYITTPADAHHIIAVGAVTSDGYRTPFSSIGPTADGRIKPDLMAMGTDVYLQKNPGIIATGQGTSYAAPIIAGLSACLWQAHPQATGKEIKDALLQSASHYHNPDNYYGYGIPDVARALEILNAYKAIKKNIPYVIIYPNPCIEYFDIVLYEHYTEKIWLHLTTLNGHSIIKKQIASNINRRIYLPEGITSGMYILHIYGQDFFISKKIVVL